MLKTITSLLSKISILKQIKHDFDIHFTLEVVPTVRFDEPAPCLAPQNIDGKEVFKEMIYRW